MKATQDPDLFYNIPSGGVVKYGIIYFAVVLLVMLLCGKFITFPGQLRVEKGQIHATAPRLRIELPLREAVKIREQDSVTVSLTCAKPAGEVNGLVDSVSYNGQKMYCWIRLPGEPGRLPAFRGPGCFVTIRGPRRSLFAVLFGVTLRSAP